jgi:hypothetical protein
VVQSGVADPPALTAKALAFADGFLAALEALPEAQVIAGRMLVKCWSNTGLILVKRWLNDGQTLVKCWSNTRRRP